MNKENLEYIKRQIDMTLEEIYEIRDNLKITKCKCEDGVIINGKSLGYGKIEKDIYQLDSIIDNLINVRNRCNQKIELIEQNNKNISNSVCINEFTFENETSANADFRGDC